jgi:hypothetical protein
MKGIGATRYPFVYRGALNTDLEYWTQETHVIDRYPRQAESLDDYVRNSIYAPSMRTAGIKTDLDFIVNVGGVYLGTDKFSHFLGSGYEYQKRYYKALSQGRTVLEAELNMIEWATSMEGGLLGLGVVGVYSYADLEANYQGFLFSQDLCNKEYLVSTLQDGETVWSFSGFDVALYINPNWDESYNANTYSKKRFKKVLTNLKSLKICDQNDSQWVLNQRKSYSSWWKVRGIAPSFSSKLLRMSQRVKGELDVDESHLSYKSVSYKFSKEPLRSFVEKAKLPEQGLYSIEALCEKVL